MAKKNPDKLSHVCEVRSNKSFSELDVENPFVHLFQEAGINVPQIDIDSSQKVLRFAVPCKLATYQCVDTICSGIRKVAPDATFNWIGLGIENPDLKAEISVSTQKFEKGQLATVLYSLPLPGNYNSPPISEAETHEVKDIFIDSKGNQHVDLGLASTINFVNSYETKEPLPNGDKVHWVHPSRLQLVF